MSFTVATVLTPPVLARCRNESKPRVFFLSPQRVSQTRLLFFNTYLLPLEFQTEQMLL